LHSVFPPDRVHFFSGDEKSFLCFSTDFSFVGVLNFSFFGPFFYPSCYYPFWYLFFAVFPSNCQLVLGFFALFISFAFLFPLFLFSDLS